MAYVNGFLAPLAKDQLEAYKKTSEVFSKAAMAAGAISCVESYAEGLDWGQQTSFPRAVDLKEGEGVLFSWVMWPSKEVADKGNEAVMADADLQAAMQAMTFDGKRMIWSGFEAISVGRGGRGLMADIAPQSTFAPDLLKGKTAFIAGGTSGINLGIAKRFTGLGARVAVLGRNVEKAKGAAAEIGGGAVAVTGDVRDYAAVEAALREVVGHIGKLDILIAGQAGNFPAPALGMSANAFAAVVGIDLLGSFNLFRAGFEHLNTPGASLIAITAGQAVKPVPLQAHVCAAKAGVNMLCKCLSLEWGPLGVRVNLISPGPIEGTEGMARLAPTAEAEAQVVAGAPLRRFGRADEIGDAAAYLCSPAGAYVTGTVLEVDGGTGLMGYRLVGLN